MNQKIVKIVFVLMILGAIFGSSVSAASAQPIVIKTPIIQCTYSSSGTICKGWMGDTTTIGT